MSFIYAAVFLLQAVVVRAYGDGIAVEPIVIPWDGAKAVAPPLGCTQYAGLVEFCESATVNFDYLPKSQLASCLCYTSSTWAPSYFDGAVKECVSWASTADSEIYDGLEVLQSFCTQQGNVRAPKTATAITTGSNIGATTTPKPASGTLVTTGPVTACASIDAAVSSCEAATPDWRFSAATGQASCICYSGTKWTPDIFDGAVHTCVGYLSTAYPSQYSTVVSLENWCTRKGDVRANTAATLTPTGGATRSIVVVQSNPPTPSIGTEGPTSSSSRATTTTTPAPATIVVTVQASATSATATRSGAMASRGVEGMFAWLAFSLAAATLGMCVFL